MAGFFVFAYADQAKTGILLLVSGTMKQRISTLLILFILVAPLLEAKTRDDRTAQGAVIGGILGRIIGHQSDKDNEGTAIGAVVGGFIGNQIGADEDRRAEEEKRLREAQRAEAVRRAAIEAENERRAALYRYNGPTYRTTSTTTTTDQDVLRAKQEAEAAEARVAELRRKLAEEEAKRIEIQNARAREAAAQEELRRLEAEAAAAGIS